MKLETKLQGTAKKWSNMLDPYRVLTIKGEIVTLGNNTTKTLANIDHIAHFTQPEERITAKLKKRHLSFGL